MPSSRSALKSSTPNPIATASASESFSSLPSSTFAGPSYTTPSSKPVFAHGRETSDPPFHHYHYQPSFNQSPAANTTYPKPYIAPQGPVVHSTQAVFTAALPRTSSLLPPPTITAELAPDETLSNSRYPIETPTAQEHPSDPANNLGPPRASRRSRSSSVGGLADGFRNLNRWSASTASSKASNITGFSRRMSVDVLGYGSPRGRLQKARPSTSSDSPRSVVSRVRAEEPTPAPVPPLQSLPQIVALPSLEQEVRDSRVLTAPSDYQRPIHVRRPSDDPGLYWNDSWGNSSNVPGPSSQLENTNGKMPYTQNGEMRGHTRSRSTGAKGSGDTTSSTRSRDRERERGKQPSQKAMLSKALQKANAAVQLDNDAKFEGARTAYAEACELLQQVLQRTSGEDDRKKLEAIRTTYTSRIEELDQLLPAPRPESKELPIPPDTTNRAIYNSQFGDARPPTSTSVRNGRDRDYERDSHMVPSYSIPTSATRRQFEPKTPMSATDNGRNGPSTYLSEQYSLQSSFSKSPRRFDGEMVLQPPPMNSQYMPPPLSPRRPVSPATKPVEQDSPERVMRADYSIYAPNNGRLAPSAMPRGHQRGNSHESISWLDPIDESGGSTASSVHSRSSSLRIRRKHIRAASGDTEAEFDAALDDAIEAAYNDGYDMDHGMDNADGRYPEESEDTYSKALRKVELARERVREHEREAMELANERERRLRQQLQDMEEEEERSLRSRSDTSASRDVIVEDFYDGNDSDEEERMLEEMTRGYAIEDFALSNKPRKSVPRESDSSELTSRTWHSSMGSNPPTGTTVLTTLSESTVSTVMSKPPTALPPPPSQALPQIPQMSPQQSSKESVRSRRLSGQNPKQLKIETSKLAPTGPPATAAPAPQARVGSYIAQQRQALSAGGQRPPLSARPSVSPIPDTVREETATPPVAYGNLQDGEPRSGSPARALRKKVSSTSLKSMKSRNLSVSHLDDASDISPGTPLSNPFGAGGSNSRLPAMPSLPTPVATAFKDRMYTSTTGGLYLFESDFHSPRSAPGSPRLASDAPAPLEACPSAISLRPFWLMRCLYQTLCNPRGGYISNKLFVPRDVWRVKGVKLKNIDEKISNCDMLTAALQKLSKVDTCDADAVLEEMQSLENVLEQVQAALARRLGNEVGVQGVHAMFKEANAGEPESGGGGVLPRSTSIAGKGSFSWRRLRSKTSSAGLATSYSGKGGSGGATATTPVDGSGGGKDMLLPSLPMASQPTSRPAKRDFASVQFGGPNAQYMSSLAKLFDAAQAIDQIARQVEDPGLRHADKTQVGLELCTRHAAEFFGFYICRFVLTDLTLLLDKFIKRGSEWVLA